MLLYFVIKACNGFCSTKFAQSQRQQQRVSVKTISYCHLSKQLIFFLLFHCFAVTELNQQRFLQVFITKRKLAILFTQFPHRHSSCQVVTRGKSFIISCQRIYIEVLDQSLHENFVNHMSNFIQSKSVNNMLAQSFSAFSQTRR